MSRRNCLMMQVIVHFCQIQSSLWREKFLMTLEIVHIRHTHTNRAAMPEICNCTGTFSWKFGCYPCVLTKCSTRETKCTSLRSWQNNYLKLLSNFCYFYVTIDRQWNCQPTSEKYCKRCFEWTHLIYMVQFNGKLGPTLCRPVPNVHNFRSSAHNLWEISSGGVQAIPIISESSCQCQLLLQPSPSSISLGSCAPRGCGSYLGLKRAKCCGGCYWFQLYCEGTFVGSVELKVTSSARKVDESDPWGHKMW